ncbi:MAG: hypothetical protein ACLFTW_02935 [Chitinispirillaceae bacterium]
MKKTFHQDQYHLLVKAGDVCISWLMRSVNSAYAKHFNKHCRRHGEVFPERYTSVIIDGQYGLEEATGSEDLCLEKKVQNTSGSRSPLFSSHPKNHKLF